MTFPFFGVWIEHVLFLYMFIVCSVIYVLRNEVDKGYYWEVFCKGTACSGLTTKPSESKHILLVVAYVRWMSYFLWPKVVDKDFLSLYPRMYVCLPGIGVQEKGNIFTEANGVRENLKDLVKVQTSSTSKNSTIMDKDYNLSSLIRYVILNRVRDVSRFLLGYCLRWVRIFTIPVPLRIMNIRSYDWSLVGVDNKGVETLVT